MRHIEYDNLETIFRKDGCEYVLDMECPRCLESWCFIARKGWILEEGKCECFRHFYDGFKCKPKEAKNGK